MGKTPRTWLTPPSAAPSSHDTKGRTAAALQENRQAVAEMQSVRDSQAQMTAAQLTQAREQIATQGQQLQAEGQQLQDAEQRASSSLRPSSRRIASVKNDRRGMVITLSGGRAVCNGPIDASAAGSTSKLTEVANVLGQQDKERKDPNRGVHRIRPERWRPTRSSRKTARRRSNRSSRRTASRATASKRSGWGRRILSPTTRRPRAARTTGA